MTTNEILAALDSEIARLTTVRNLLSDIHESPVQAAVSTLAGSPVKRGRGRPKGSTNKSAGTKAPAKKGAAPKRSISPEGKERIAAAQRARWAARNTPATKTSAKNAPRPAAKKSASKKAVARPDAERSKPASENATT